MAECDHEEILDDEHTGDTVCLSCGQVLSPFIGGRGGRPGRIRDRRRRECWSVGVEEEEGGGEREQWGEMERKKQWLFHLLSKFFLDNNDIGEKVWEKFYECYEGRRRRKEIRSSQTNEQLAMAHSIHSVLVQEQIPRPVKYIADLCGIPSNHQKKLLKIGQVLQTKDVYLEVNADDYVHTLCLHLHIPFAIALQAERVLQREEVKYGLYGRRPQYLAAAAVERVLEVRGYPSRLKDLCKTMECSQSNVRCISRMIDPKYCIS